MYEYNIRIHFSRRDASLRDASNAFFRSLLKCAALLVSCFLLPSLLRINAVAHLAWRSLFGFCNVYEVR